MGSCVKYKLGSWYVDQNTLFKQLSKNNISKNDIIAIEKYIINTVSHNLLFLSFALKNMKESGAISYDVGYTLTPDGTLHFINLTEDLIINNLNNSNNSGNSFFYKSISNKLEDYKSDEYFINTVLARKVNGNATYMDLINLISLDNEEFKKMVNSNNFYGLSGEELLSILAKPPIYQRDNLPFHLNIKPASSRLNFSDAIQQKIKENLLLLNYVYETEKAQVHDFSKKSLLIDAFELSDELEQSIMSEMPSNFDNLQKAYYIYKRLCQKFSYDQEYFYLQNHGRGFESRINHYDINRLSTLTGGEEVVCTGVSLLFAKFLDKLNIEYLLLDYQNEEVSGIGDGHMKVRFMVNDFLVDADPADGLFKSDLVYEKTHGRTYRFSCVNTPKRIKEAFDEKIKVVDEYFDENVTEFNDAREIYQALYKKENLELDFMDKIDILINMVKTQKFNFFEMMDLVSKTRKNLFQTEIDNIGIEFIVHKSEKNTKLEMLLAYNQEKAITDVPEENEYLIIDSTRQVKKTDYNTLREKFNDDTYDFTDGDRKFLNLKGGNVSDETKGMARRG